MAEWLQAEGFTVVCITDQDAAVTCDRIESAIGTLVTNPPTYHLLVVYFSGHGYWQARSDVWLLSGAPVKPSEAINLESAMDMARYSGVKNVVFISDACRSIPDSRSGARVEGRSGFPNYSDIDAISKIDYFKATSDALPAYEGTIGGKAQSILTHALLSAFEQPEPHMVREINEGEETIRVVPNRRLEDYLQRRVDDLLSQIDSTLSQRVEANVPSSEDVYLGRVRPKRMVRATAFESATLERVSKASPPALNTSRDAAEAVARALEKSQIDASTPVDARTEARVRDRLPDPRFDHFETETGIIVQGASVRRVLAPGGRVSAQPELLDPGDGHLRDAVVRLHGSKPQSIVLQIQNDRCVILAQLPGYIAHVRFHDAGLSNVSYVPSSNTPLWPRYQQLREQIDRLRALVAVAVEGNTFRVRSHEEAEALASMIRPLKAIDPTLGLYSAYAFSQSSNDAHVTHVLRSMQRDLQAELYDVRMLCFRRHAESDADPVVPLCPMLTQGWNLLGSRGLALPRVLENARPYLSGALWTTFEPQGATAIIEAIEKGEL
jgi:hypothetical protein